MDPKFLLAAAQKSRGYLNPKPLLYQFLKLQGILVGTLQIYLVNGGLNPPTDLDGVQAWKTWVFCNPNVLDPGFLATFLLMFFSEGTSKMTQKTEFQTWILVKDDFIPKEVFFFVCHGFENEIMPEGHHNTSDWVNFIGLFTSKNGYRTQLW